MFQQQQNIIEKAWQDRTLLKTAAVQNCIHDILELLDKGKLRVATPQDDGSWQVNDWVKKAVLSLIHISEPTRP